MSKIFFLAYGGFLLLSAFPAFSNSPRVLPLITTKGGRIHTYHYLLNKQTQIFAISPIQQYERWNGSLKSVLSPPIIPNSILEAANNPQIPFNTPYLMTNSILNSLKNTQGYGLPEKSLENFSLSPAVQQKISSVASTIRVVNWDQQLIDAKTLEFAQKNGITDLVQIERYRQGLLYEYPVNKTIVIHLRITDRSFLPLDFSPFSSHLYLVNPEDGQHIEPVYYDPALNRIIQQGETIEGNVYFPLHPKKMKVKGVLKNINGKNYSFSFN